LARAFTGGPAGLVLVVRRRVEQAMNALRRSSLRIRVMTAMDGRSACSSSSAANSPSITATMGRFGNQRRIVSSTIALSQRRPRLVGFGVSARWLAS